MSIHRRIGRTSTQAAVVTEYLGGRILEVLAEPVEYDPVRWRKDADRQKAIEAHARRVAERERSERGRSPPHEVHVVRLPELIAFVRGAGT